MREFSDQNYGRFNDEWADFFIELGQYTVENFSGNTRIIALVPTTKILAFLISIGAMNSFLKGNISTGFLPLEKIWDELQSTPIGTEVHVVDKTNGFVHHKGALDSLTSNSFLLKVTQNESHVTPGWMYEPERFPSPDIEVSITSSREFDVPDRATSTNADPNLKLLNKLYKDSDPLGVLGLPNNIIQIAGNKNTLIYESKLRFEIDEINGSFAEGLITKDVLSRRQELTKITAAKEDNLTQEANLSIFCQSSNTNISNVLDWTNNFPQIFLIPRSSRQVYDLVEMFNDEYMSREEEADFNELKIPKGCEIMGYVV